jgi:hypothetical protein
MSGKRHYGFRTGRGLVGRKKSKITFPSFEKKTKEHGDGVEGFATRARVLRRSEGCVDVIHTPVRPVPLRPCSIHCFYYREAVVEEPKSG